MSAAMRASPVRVGSAASGAASPAAPPPMAPWTRRAVRLSCATLWLSGAAWLLLHRLRPVHGEFGDLPNPWEAPLMRLHGVIAVAAVFLLGWLGASHVGARWTAGARRGSGLALLAAALVLGVRGYALYYTTGGLHDGAAAVHAWLGVAAAAAALAHWRGARERRRALSGPRAAPLPRAR